MRIVAGRFKGKALAAPAGASTRPTSDRLRETIFNVLAHGHEDVLADARVLDLFAGTGALGLEALSRGARAAVFIEEASGARAVIRRNVETLGLTGITKIFRRDATRLGPCGTMTPFDLVFLDPPYRKGLGERALASAITGGWLAPGAIAVLEEDARTELKLPENVTVLDQRTVGDSQILFLKTTD